MISFALGEELSLLQETARKFAAERLRPRLRELEASGPSEADRRAFHELGLGLVDLPEHVGGAGLGLAASVVVHEELAWGDPGAALALDGPGAAAHAVLELGDAEQQARLLAPFCAPDGWRRLGALAYSERWKLPTAGFTTVARLAGGDTYVVSGAKSFVVHGGSADLLVVFVTVDPDAGWSGAAALALEGADPARVGERHELLGLGAVDVRELVFDETQVPARNRLTGAGELAPAARRAFARVALVNAARQVGVARAAYEYALAYTQDRSAFGKPIAHFQAVSFNLADLLMDLESARWLLWQAALGFDRERDAALPDVARAAVHAAESAWRIADDAVQLLGGAGYVQDHPVEKWLRDTKALALVGPSAAHHRLVLASAELGLAFDQAPLPHSAQQPMVT